jgi:hypothetical protein
MHDIKPILDLFPNIKQYWPESEDQIPEIMKDLLNNKSPCFLSLKR